MSWKTLSVVYPSNSSPNDIVVTLFGFALPKAKQSQSFLVCTLGGFGCWFREKSGLARDTECQVTSVKKDAPYAAQHSDLEGLLEEGSAHLFSRPASPVACRKISLEVHLQGCMSIWELALDPFNITWTPKTLLPLYNRQESPASFCLT